MHEYVHAGINMVEYLQINIEYRGELRCKRMIKGLLRQSQKLVSVTLSILKMISQHTSCR